MGIITKIEQQKRNDDRVNIYVDDKFFIAIFKELVYTSNLKKGNEINEEELKPILDDEMYIKAKNKALNILSHADQSEKKLKEKLSSEFDENIIERVIDFLKSYNLVNDSVLAQKIVNTNVNLNKCGKNRIKQNLYNKGINRSTINEAVSELDKERVKKEDKKKIYQKISQHLSYKGFDYDIIKRVLNKLLNFDEYDI